jgi:hypothetical protein
MSKQVKEYEELTREILSKYREKLVREFQKVDAGKEATLLVTLKKEVLSGKGDMEYYVVSPTYNEPLYKVFPEFMKERITKNPDKIYVVFSGWDGLIASYLLIKGHVIKNN